LDQIGEVVFDHAVQKDAETWLDGRIIECGVQLVADARLQIA